MARRSSGSVQWAMVVLAVWGVGWTSGCGKSAARSEGNRETPVPALASTAPSATRPSGTIVSGEGWRATRTADEVAAIERIRAEGLERSQVMDTLDYLTNVIGPRLTGSPQLKRANEWSRDKLSEWGLTNASLEQWGPFGRGWSLERFSMQVVSPDTIILTGYPKAWSASLNDGEPTVSEVVHIDTGKPDLDLESFRGTLKGKVVLIGAVRTIEARFEPLATRVTDDELRRLAAAPPPGQGGGGAAPATTRAAVAEGGAVASGAVLPGQARGDTAGERRAAFAETPAGQALARAANASTQPSASTQPGSATRGSAGSAQQVAQRAFNLAAAEGAAVVVTPSTRGDGGTFFVQGASVPSTQPASGQGPGGRARPWAAGTPDLLPQVMVTAEDFNRLARMMSRGIELKVRTELKARYHTDDLYAYNTVAEIPGTDLAHEVVMLGAHIDSWQASTGTTDNGVGTATMMEAMRILQATGIRPRRTIRIGLWSGEEQGIYGSAAYVNRHFGVMETSGTASGTTRPVRKLTRRPGYESFSVYFNMDNGTGRLRGIYTQGNVAAVGVFAEWFKPVADLEAKTITLSNTGSTDHVPFDTVGLPGFQFIQDSVEYFSRTWHSSQDNYDRAQANDLKQASTVIATLAYQAAMSDQRFPRKPLPPGTVIEDSLPGVVTGEAARTETGNP